MEGEERASPGHHLWEGFALCVLILPPGAAGALEESSWLGSDSRASEEWAGTVSAPRVGTQHPGTWGGGRQEPGGSLMGVFFKSPQPMKGTPWALRVGMGAPSGADIILGQVARARRIHPAHEAQLEGDRPQGSCFLRAAWGRQDKTPGGIQTAQWEQPGCSNRLPVHKPGGSAGGKEASAGGGRGGDRRWSCGLGAGKSPATV